jgi:hypothetical protein
MKRIWRWFTRLAPAWQAVVVLVLLVVFGTVIGTASSRSGSKSKPANAAPAAAATAAATKTEPTTTASAGKAKFKLVVRGSACGEDAARAEINCHVAVRNIGDAPGENPTVYVSLDYSDGGSSTTENDLEAYSPSNEPGGFTIAPETTRVIYMVHTYNAQQHDLVKASAQLDLSAKWWPYITVT